MSNNNNSSKIDLIDLIFITLGMAICVNWFTNKTDAELGAIGVLLIILAITYYLCKSATTIEGKFFLAGLGLISVFITLFFLSPKTLKIFEDTSTPFVQSAQPTVAKLPNYTVSNTPTIISRLTVNIDSAVTARGYFNREPVDVTDTFAPSDRTIYAVIKFEKRPPITTKVRAVWTAINADGSSDQFLDTDFVTSKGEDIVNFSAALPDKDWPVGKYKVDIYVNNSLAKTMDYYVR